jgi:hypothetical protein
VNNSESTSKILKFGVPQGSKLGPVLFNAYVAPLSMVAENNGISDHKYADDEQLILAFKPDTITEESEAFSKMVKCLDEIRQFLFNNKLLNNGDKTEFIVMGSKHNLQKLKKCFIKVADPSIKVVDNVKNLGVLFDSKMTMEPQIKNMCKKAFLKVRNIAHIRQSLNSNALLYGANNKYLNKLQMAQNAAARLIERLKKHDHITDTRKQLHWLPSKSRIEFKVLNMTWKALNNKSP